MIHTFEQHPELVVHQNAHFMPDRPALGHRSHSILKRHVSMSFFCRNGPDDDKNMRHPMHTTASYYATAVAIAMCLILNVPAIAQMPDTSRSIVTNSSSKIAIDSSSKIATDSSSKIASDSLTKNTWDSLSKSGFAGAPYV